MHSLNEISNRLTLAIHSTDSSYGFAYRLNDDDKSDKFFIRNLQNDLCNNLVQDFNEFVSNKNFKKINRISVSTGPANFNASRLIVVLARTIAQQIKCPLESFSCFELMSKRIAINNICENTKSFWIYNKLKKKGFIAGQYEIVHLDKESETIEIREKIIPKVFQELKDIKPCFQANYDDKKDLKELLNFSSKNIKTLSQKSWEDVLPLYPISPVN